MGLAKNFLEITSQLNLSVYSNLLPTFQYIIPKNSLINVLHTNLCLRVCFPGDVIYKPLTRFDHLGNLSETDVHLTYASDAAVLVTAFLIVSFPSPLTPLWASHFTFYSAPPPFLSSSYSETLRLGWLLSYCLKRWILEERLHLKESIISLDCKQLLMLNMTLWLLMFRGQISESTKW